MLYRFLRNAGRFFAVMRLIFVWFSSHHVASATAIPKTEYAGKLDEFLCPSGFDAGLLAYLYLVLSPHHGASLHSLLDRSPDLGVLSILVTAFALGWMTVSAWILVKVRSR
jgi:hypothetical protein